MIIYKITNLINNKVYIGQTTESLQKRWKRHTSEYHEKNMYISRTISKYGEKNFIIEKICECYSLQELNEKEIFYINEYDSLSPNGYNLVVGGNNSKMSDETKLKISNSHKKRYLDGKVISEETRKKLSESHKGWIPSEETRQKWRDAFSGKKPSEKTRIGAISHHQKTYTFESPDGEIITFTNMKDFCKKNNLCNSKLCLVASGKRNHHKGWKLHKSHL
jgi:group I intron endonuclease